MTKCSREKNIRLIHKTGEYLEFNKLLLNELIFDNDPLNINYLGEWPPTNRLTVAPYSSTLLQLEEASGTWTTCECANSHYSRSEESSSMHYESEDGLSNDADRENDADYTPQTPG